MISNTQMPMQKHNEYEKNPSQHDSSKITNLTKTASNESEFDEVPDKEFQMNSSMMKETKEDRNELLSGFQKNIN